MTYYWRDSVTDPPSEEEYPDSALLVCVRHIGGFETMDAGFFREFADDFPKWAPLPTDPPVPDSELIVPLRCGCGGPRYVGIGLSACALGRTRPTQLMHGLFVPRHNATVSLDKAPPFDPWQVAARHPMHLLEDGHGLECVIFRSGGGFVVRSNTSRSLDHENGRVAWCPLAPLLALLDSNGAET